jgi:hypothetical protein
LKSRKAKPDAPRPLTEKANEIDKLRRRRIGAACTVLRVGLKIEQMIQWLYSRERKTGEAVSRSWEEWADTLKCHPVTAKRNAQKALELGLIQYAEGLTRFGGDSKNRFAIDWEGINEALGFASTPPSDRGAKCAGEGSILLGGGEQNAHAFKDVTLDVSLDTSLTTTSSSAGAGENATTTSGVDFEKCNACTLHDPAEAYDLGSVLLVAQCEVDQAARFTRNAIDRGDDVRAIVAAWRKRERCWKPEWAVAKLAVRLRDGRPGCTPEQGWPRLDFPHLLPPKPRSPKTVAPSDSPSEATKDSTKRLETLHGASLDAIPIDERVAMLTAAERTFHEPTIRRGGGRWLLLPKLEARQGGSTEIRVVCVPSANGNAGDRGSDGSHVRLRETTGPPNAKVVPLQHATRAAKAFPLALLGPCPGGVR